MLLARQRAKKVRKEQVRRRVAVRDSCLLRPDSGAGREVLHQHRQAPEGKTASPQISEIDSVEALKISLKRVGVVPEDCDERR